MYSVHWSHLSVKCFDGFHQAVPINEELSIRVSGAINGVSINTGMVLIDHSCDESEKNNDMYVGKGGRP